MRRKVELQSNCFAFKHLKQRVDREAVFTEKIGNFGEHRLTYQHWSPHVFHDRYGPRVMRIVAIEKGKERPRVTYRDHGRLNLARAFVAGNRPPAKLPAKSAVIE